MMREIEPWTARLRVQGNDLRLRVSGRGSRLILSGRFTGYPDHPRALLTVLEGLALWRGAPLSVVIAAATPVSHSLGLGAFGGERWPTASALVHFEWQSEAARRRAGVPDEGEGL
jgi:hypothetical protein